MYSFEQEFEQEFKQEFEHELKHDNNMLYVNNSCISIILFSCSTLSIESVYKCMCIVHVSQLQFLLKHGHRHHTPCFFRLL